MIFGLPNWHGPKQLPCKVQELALAIDFPSLCLTETGLVLGERELNNMDVVVVWQVDSVSGNRHFS